MQPSVGSFVSDFRSRPACKFYFKYIYIYLVRETIFPVASPAYNEFTRSIHSYDPNYLSSSSSTNSRDQQKDRERDRDRDRDRDRERASTTAPVANHNSYAAAAASQSNQHITPGTGPRGGSVSALSTSPSASVFTNSHLQLGGSGTRSSLHPAGAPGMNSLCARKILQRIIQEFLRLLHHLQKERESQFSIQPLCMLFRAINQ